MNQLLLIRSLAAVLYSIAMLADITLELTGRYARSSEGLTRMPYMEQHKIGNAILWAVLHILLVLWLLDDGWHGWAYAPFLPMTFFFFQTLKRIHKTLL